MKSAEQKTSSGTSHLPSKKDGPFFSKAKGEGFAPYHSTATPFFAGGHPVQAKLNVHPAGDQYEKEADATADRVVNEVHTPQVQKKESKDQGGIAVMHLANGISRLQRQRAFDSPTAMEKDSAGSGEQMALQTKADGTGSEAGGGVESQLMESKGKGNSLPGDTRSNMESGFGADFSGVRVHNDDQSAQLNRQLGAKAFTHGNDVYFNQGEYQPGTKSGDHLIAHELTHTVQQGASKAGVQRKAAETITRLQRTNSAEEPVQQQTEASNESNSLQMQSASAPADSDAGTGAYNGPGSGSPANNIIQKEEGPTGNDGKAHDGAAGKVERAGNTYTLEVKEINLPSFKSTISTAELKVPNSERDNKQVETWEKGIQGEGGTAIDNLVKDLVGKSEAIDDKKTTYAFKYNNGYLIGTQTDLKKKIIRPFWDKSGQSHSFHVDHMHEFQIGGPDSYSNLWLLDGSINVASGKVIKAEKDKKIKALIDEAATKSKFWPKGKPDVNEVKGGGRFKVNFKGKGNSLGGVKPPGANDKYEKKDIIDGLSAKPLKVLSKADLKKLGATKGADEITLFLRQQGGKAHKLKKEGSDDIRVGNIYIKPVKSGISQGENDEILAGSKINVEVFKKTPQINKFLQTESGANKTFPVNVYSMQSLPNLGYLNSQEWSKELKNLVKIAGLSPIEILDMDLEDNTGITLRAKILTSIPIISNANIEFVIRGEEFYLEKTFTAEEFKVPAPFKINGCSLTIRAGTIGLELEGNVSFGIDRVGEGSVSAYINSKKEFGVKGSFEFDKKLFDNAKVEVAYEKEQWSVKGTIEIPPKKIKGIKKATATIAYSEGTLAASGTVEPDIKGVKQGSFELKYSAEQFIVSGKLTLSPEIPRLKKGEINVTLESKADSGYKLKGSGIAEFDFPGINTGLNVQYDDGLLTVEATVNFEKGIAKGEIKAGATNRPVDGQGNPQGEPGDKWTIYGGGTLTVKITPWLQATAGVHFLPNGELEVLGRIELPSTVDVFPQKSFEKTLFSMPTIEIPLFAIPLGPKSLGLVAQIRGGLDFKASIGPGQLKGLFGEIKYNPSKPEETTLSGGGSFVIPAEAGLSLHASLGLGLSVGIASLTGGIELAAGVGLKGEASAGVNVTWNPNTGLELNAEGKIMVQPKFKFDVNLFARASLDLFLFEISKEWRYNLASFEWGPGFEFGLIFPVHYKEGQPFNISFDDIQVIKPDLDILGTVKGIANKVKEAVF